MKYMLIGLSFLSLTFNAFALSAEDIYSKSSFAILHLTTNDSAGKYWHATGFFVGKEGLVLTNHHVIDDIDGIVGKSQSGNEYIGFKLLYSDKNSDIAVLKVANIQKNDTYLELASDEKKYSIGNDIFWIGHPSGIEKFSFSKGYISQIKMKENVELLQFNGVAYHGSSGSPLLNSDGEVIGIIHSGLENSSKNVIGTGLGSGRNNISEVLDRALNQYPVNTISEATAEPINEITASATISESSENARTLVNTEPKNDLASLIRELKAYTPPSEVRLGSK